MKLQLHFHSLLVTGLLQASTFQRSDAFIPLPIKNLQPEMSLQIIHPIVQSLQTQTALFSSQNPANDEKSNPKEIIKTESKVVSYKYTYNDVDEVTTNKENALIISEKKLLQDTLDNLAYTLGPTHIETMRALYNLALFMYENNNDIENAIKFFNVAYVQRRSVLGINHPDSVASLNRLVLLHHDEGNYDLAAEYVLDRITMFEEKLDESTLDYILKIAFAYHREGIVDDAIKCYKLYLDHCNDNDALKNDTSDITPTPIITATATDTPSSKLVDDMLTAQHNLAVLYQGKGEFDEARPLMEECLLHRKLIYGGAHPLTLSSMNNLAALYHKSGKYGAALSFYEYCLDLKKSSLGPDHPETLLTERNLKRLRKAMK